MASEKADVSYSQWKSCHELRACLGELSFTHFSRSLKFTSQTYTNSTAQLKKTKVRKDSCFFLKQQKRSLTSPWSWVENTHLCQWLQTATVRSFFLQSPTEQICPTPLYPAQLPFSTEPKSSRRRPWTTRQELQRRGDLSNSDIRQLCSTHSHGPPCPHQQLGSISLGHRRLTAPR